MARPALRWTLRGLVAVLVVIGFVLAGLFTWITVAPASFLRTAQHWQTDVALGSATTVQAPTGPVRVWHLGREHGGPPVVLVHGFVDAAAGWDRVGPALAEAHHVVVLDLPGHGRSAPQGEALTLAQVQGGLDAVLDSLDGPVVLVGNSLGGWVTTRWSLAHPERVQRLILVNAAGLAWPVERDRLLPTTREGIREKNRIILGPDAPDLPGFLLDGLLAMHAEPRLHALYDDLYADPPHLDGALGELSVPVTLVWGTPDPFFPVEGYLQRWQAGLPTAPTMQLDGCGHAPQYSCPDRLIDALREAIDG